MCRKYPPGLFSALYNTKLKKRRIRLKTYRFYQKHFSLFIDEKYVKNMNLFCIIFFLNLIFLCRPDAAGVSAAEAQSARVQGRDNLYRLYYSWFMKTSVADTLGSVSFRRIRYGFMKRIRVAINLGKFT